MRVYETLRLAGHFMTDHVHMLLPVLPKNAVAQAVRRIKVKSEIHIARGVCGTEEELRGAALLGEGIFGCRRSVGRYEASV